MFSPKDYLYTIAAKRKEYFTALLQEENLNLLEVEILIFLHHHPESNTLTDIIHARDFTKSHASTAISHLEANGYLSKNTSAQNKKTLRLTLLPKSEALVAKALACIKEFHKVALVGITAEETEIIEALLEKICNNLKENN